MAGETILVADDSTTVVTMLTALLQGAGYQVIAAADGVAAAEKAFSERPDLILLDVAMPHMNGNHVCRLIKSEPALRDTPVLLLTSRDQVSDKFWGAQSGADRYLTKECPPDEILAVVRALLESRPTPRDVARALGPQPNSRRDLLSRLNDLLDRRLFQATVLNEIARLARSLQDLKRSADAVLKTLSQLVDYHLAAVALAEEEPGELYVRQAKPVTPSCLDRFERHCFDTLTAHLGQPPRRGRWQVSILDETQGGEPCDDLEQLITLPLESDDRPLGLLALAGGRRQMAAIAQDDQHLPSSLADQVYIVLDNALLYRKVQVMAIHDELTGLHNFRHLREKLAEEFARAVRYGSELSLILLDIDHFKAINDRCGHQMGNVVLTQIVDVMRAQIRENDVPARYGGEEFAVILPNTGVDGAVQVAERVRESIAAHTFGSPDDPQRLTVSLGVTSYPGVPASAPDELITQADNALYAAKGAGRDRVRHVLEPDYDHPATRADSTAA